MAVNIGGFHSKRGHRRVGMEERITHETTAVFAPIAFYDDFNGADLVIPDEAVGAQSGCKWVKLITAAAGAPVVEVVPDMAQGVVQLVLEATNEKQEAGLYMNDQRTFPLNGAVVTAGRGLVFETRISLWVLPTGVAEMYWGLAGAYVEGIIATDGPAEHIFFVADGSGAVIIYTDDTANDNDGVATGVTLVAQEWAIFRIDASNPADVHFYINGVRVAAATTFDMSTAASLTLQPYFMCHKETTAAVGTLKVDYARIWANRA